MLKIIYKYISIILVMSIIISCQDNSNPVIVEQDKEEIIKSNIPTESFRSISAVEETLIPFLPVLPSGFGSGMIVAGTGLHTQPGFIDVKIPNGASIEKVYIYWVGKGNEPNGGDNTIEINGTEVLGTLVGNSKPIKGDIIFYTYRANLTNLNLNFESLIAVDGVEFNGKDARADGASIVIIYRDDAKGKSDLVLLEGADFAWLCAPDGSYAETYVTNEQSFTFPSSQETRNASLYLMTGDAESVDRPDRVTVIINGEETIYDGLLNGSAGNEFDVVELLLVIPAGVTEVKVQLESGPGNCGGILDPESLVWIFGGLSISNLPQEDGCTYTQGYWKNHPEDWPVEKLKLGTIEYNKSELIAILKKPVRGNGLISLAYQLIAAKLNLAKGANGSEILGTISQADLLIGNLVIPPIGEDYLDTNITSTFSEKLDEYNNGIIGPGHCD